MVAVQGYLNANDMARLPEETMIVGLAIADAADAMAVSNMSLKKDVSSFRTLFSKERKGFIS